MKNTEISFVGTISVKSVLEEKKRKIIALFVDPKKRSKDIAYCIALAKQASIPVNFVERDEMNYRFEKGHGGIALIAYAISLPMLDSSKPLNGFCAYISGVEDPYNMGAIARTLYAAGANTLLIQNRDWSQAQSTLLRSSAGAWERLSIQMVDQEEDLIGVCQKQNLPLICAYRDNAHNVFTYEFPSNCLIVIGGAMRGISSRVLQHATTNIYIPYGREFRNALDTPAATAVIAFAWSAKHPYELK